MSLYVALTRGYTELTESFILNTLPDMRLQIPTLQTTCLAMMLGAAVNTSWGVDVRWKGNNNNNYGNKDNWRIFASSNRVPTSSDTVLFTDIAETKRADLDLNEDRDVAGVTLDCNDLNYGTSSNPWNLFGGRLINSGDLTWNGSSSDAVYLNIQALEQTGNSNWNCDALTPLDFSLNGKLEGTGKITLSTNLATQGVYLKKEGYYTGTFRVETGKLVLQHVDALKDAELNISLNGKVETTGVSHNFRALTGAGSFNIDANHALTVNDDIDRSYDGTITGAGGVIKEGINDWTLEEKNTHSGVTEINSGKLYLAHPEALLNSIVEINVDDGLKLNESSIVGGLTGNYAFKPDYSLTIQSPAGSWSEFEGELQSSSSADVTIIKNGSGTQVFSHSLGFNAGNSFRVNEGSLIFNGSTGDAPIVVSGGGTLGGSGVVNSHITIEAGGTLQPGDHTHPDGTEDHQPFEAKSLDLHGVYHFSGASYWNIDELIIHGNLDITGATLDLHVHDDVYADPNEDPDVDSIIIASYSGSLTGTFAAVNGLPDEWYIDYAYDDGSSIAILPYGELIVTDIVSFPYDNRFGENAAGSGPTQGVEFTVHFNQPVSNFDSSDIIVNYIGDGEAGNPVVSAYTQQVYSVHFNAANGLNGEGDLFISIDPNSDIRNGSNTMDPDASAVSSRSILIDLVPPALTHWSAHSEPINALSAPRLEAFFNEAIYWDAGTIYMSPSSSAGISFGSTDFVTESQSAALSFNSVSGEGSLTASLHQGQISDIAGNYMPSGDLSHSVSVDTILPTLTSITTLTSTPTNASDAIFVVQFSEGVSGFDDPDDLLVTLTGDVSYSSREWVSSYDASTYTITFKGLTGSGLLAIQLPSDHSIYDLRGNPLLGSTDVASITLDNTGPEVVSITPYPDITPQVNGDLVRSGTSLAFLVEYSEPVFGVLDPDDFLLTATSGAPLGNMQVLSFDSQSLIVAISNIPYYTSATYTLTPLANASVTDALGNALADPMQSLSVRLDNTHPELLSVTALSNSPSRENTADFRLVFSEPIEGIVSFRQLVIQTTEGNVSVADVSNFTTSDNITFNLTLTGITGEGSFTLSVADLDLVDNHPDDYYASIRDDVGNRLEVAAVSAPFVIDSFQIDTPIAVDDWINEPELNNRFYISGTTELEHGQTVTITIEDHTTTTLTAPAVVQSDGSWSLPIGDETLYSDQLVVDESGTERDPVVATLADGGWVVAWWVPGGDAGDGSDKEIIQQRYAADGTQVGGTVKVDASDAEDDDTVSVAALNDGGWVVAWRSQGGLGDGNDSEIAIQRYDSSGVAVDGNRLVNQPDSHDDNYPNVIGLPDGGWLVTWNSASLSGNGTSHNLISQRYAADGSTVGANFMLNDEDNAPSLLPSVSILTDGRWLATWQQWDGLNGNWDAFYQLFDSDGSALSTAISTNDSSTDARSEIRPSGTALSDGGWVVSWIWKDGSTNNALYYQHYDASGALTVSGRVDDVSSGGLSSSSYGLSTLRDDSYVFAWSTNSLGNRTLSQRFDATGIAMGGNTPLSLENGCANPATSALRDGGWITAWQRNSGIEMQRHTADGDLLPDLIDISGLEDGILTITATAVVQSDGSWSLPIGDDTLYRDQLVVNEVGTERDPVVATLADGGWIVAWWVPGGDVGDGSDKEIIQQRYAADGTKVGGTVKVDASDAEDDDTVSVAALNDGGWVVAWRSQGGLGDGNDSEIAIQRYNSSGVAVDSNRLVNQPDSHDDNYPNVTGLPDGGWLVTWNSASLSGNGTSHNLISQRYAADGSTVGANFMLNDEDNAPSLLPSVSILTDGRWLATWQQWDGLNGNWDAFYQLFDSDGSALSTAISTNDSSADNRSEIRSSGTALSDGGWVVSWIWKDGSTNNALYYQHFDASGALVTSGKVNGIEPLYSSFYRLSAFDDGGFLFVLDTQDTSLGNSIQIHRYSGTGYAFTTVTATAYDLAGLTFYTDTVTAELDLNVAVPTDLDSPYDEWVTENDLDDSGFNDDPDGDGVPNIEEFAFNTDPNSGDAETVLYPSFYQDANDGLDYFVVTLPMRDSAVIIETDPTVDVETDEGVHYFLEATVNFETYDTIVTQCVPTQDTGLPALSAGWSYQSFKIIKSSKDKGFVCVEVSTD